MAFIIIYCILTCHAATNASSNTISPKNHFLSRSSLNEKTTLASPL